MKVVAYVALHYGAEWLSWAIRSVRDVVDEVIVVYSRFPSYGYHTSIPCPESPELLKHLATSAGAVWYEVDRRFPNEGAHRNVALEYCQHNHNADYVVVLDADEVWDVEHLVQCLVEVEDAAKPARNWRVAFRHFWRSLNWVCYDDAMPVRIIDLTLPNNEADGYIGANLGRVNHFGYAQSSNIVKYKWRIHGHLPELRPNWFDGTFIPWQPGHGDVHPTCADNYWDPIPFDRNSIGHLVGDHPYFFKEMIT